MNVYLEDVVKKLADECTTLEEFKQALRDANNVLDLDTIDAAPGDVIVVSYPVEYADGAVQLVQLLNTIKSDVPAIELVDSIDVMIEYPENALKMLDNMKDKITSKTGKSSIRDQILMK